MKKRAVLNRILVIMIVGAFLIGSANVLAAENDSDQIDIALAAFFSEREQEYYGSNGMQRGILAEEKQERLEFIDAWMDDLLLDVVAVSSEYVIKDVIMETQGTTKLHVYEWVWIDYICRGYEEIETMGFGTDHILTISQENGEMQVVNDTYSEITGFEIGDEEDFDVLKQTYVVEAELSVQLLEDMSTEMFGIATSSAGYDREAAVRYADQYCGNPTSGTAVSGNNTSAYNSAYYYYDGFDCCNFVSQCLAAGGMTMEGTWYAQANTSGSPVDAREMNVAGEAWINTQKFSEYWEKQCGEKIKITNAAYAVNGNPLFWLKTDGNTYNHNMLIVGTNSSRMVLVDGHNPDAYHYPVNLLSNTFYTIDLYK